MRAEVRFGVLLGGLGQRPIGHDMSSALDDVLRFVSLAEDLGFDYVALGQHYLTAPYQMFQPIPLAARIAAATTQLEIVCSLLLPLHQPVDLAENLATLDVISGGRLVVSCLLGYRDEEYRALGVDPASKVSRFTECLDLLIRLWTERDVDSTGKHFPLTHAHVTMPTVRRPHPPIWIAGNSDHAVGRAAKRGLRWHVNPHATLGTIARQANLYKMTALQSGRTPQKLALARELYCAESDQTAFEDVSTYIGAKYSSYSQWGQDRVLPETSRFMSPIDELAADRFILGSPERCVTLLRPYLQLGVDRMHFRVAWPGMPFSVAERTLRMLSNEVIPHVSAAAEAWS